MQILYAVLHARLEHLWILVSQGFWTPFTADTNDDFIVTLAKALTNWSEGNVSRKKIFLPGVNFLVAIWKLLGSYLAQPP